MAVEIERKFLVHDAPEWRSVAGVQYRQGYLMSGQGATVRVRVAGEQAFLTIKGKSTGAARLEFEYAIPLVDAEELLRHLVAGPLVEKVRRKVEFGGCVWEVDEFFGDNEGLLMAEIELEREDQPFAKPPWVGLEVTGDVRYYNARLAVHPYSRWER